VAYHAFVTATQKFMELKIFSTAVDGHVKAIPCPMAWEAAARGTIVIKRPEALGRTSDSGISG
jgi:hypothetical protein